MLGKAYKIIFMSPDLLLKDALEKAANEVNDCEPVEQLINFFQNSKQGVIRTVENVD